MRKIYLLLLATLLGGALANAQTPLEGYEAPTFGSGSQVGKVNYFKTEGATVNLELGNQGMKGDQSVFGDNVATQGYVSGSDISVEAGQKIDITIELTSRWGVFSLWSDANDSKAMTMLTKCNVNKAAGGTAAEAYREENTDAPYTVYLGGEETPLASGTLPSVTIPENAEVGTVYLLRLIFAGGASYMPTTYNGSYSEGYYRDFKIQVVEQVVEHTVNFSATNGTLTLKVDGTQAIESGAQVVEGKNVTIEATPDAGYELVSITNNDAIFPNSTFTVTEDVNLIATFKELATEGDAMLMSAPGYGTIQEAQLRFSDTVLGSHNTEQNQVSSDQRSRNYTFSAWVSPMGYNGVFMGHVQNDKDWAIEGSYGIGVQDGKLAVWYRIWDGTSVTCNGAPTPAVAETATLYPGEFAFITLATSNDGKTFKVYKNGEEVISQDVADGGLALLYDACDFAIGDSKNNKMASKVEEVQLWNKTLTADEIKASMYGYTEMPEGLVAYYRPESATETTVENLAGDIDAYYRVNGKVANDNFPMASAIQKTNGRETVEVTYNTPAEEGAAYTLQRYGVDLAASPAPVKVYSNLYAVNGSETYEISSVTVDETALTNVTDPIQVATSPVTVNVTFDLASGIEEVAAEAIYYSNNVLYMPEGATAVIYNLLGAAVAEVAEPAADLAQLPAGIYLAKVSMDGNYTIIRFKK